MQAITASATVIGTGTGNWKYLIDLCTAGGPALVSVSIQPPPTEFAIRPVVFWNSTRPAKEVARPAPSIPTAPKVNDAAAYPEKSHSCASKSASTLVGAGENPCLNRSE